MKTVQKILDAFERFRDTSLWRWILTMMQIALIAAVLLLGSLLIRSFGIAESAEEWEERKGYYEVYYVVCSANDCVNVRPYPHTRQEPVAMLEPGTMVKSDGRRENGYLHVYGLSSEDGEGWIYEGYLVDDKPVFVNTTAKVTGPGRLAARKCVDGKLVRWLSPGTVLKVWFMSNEWSVTNRGYVRTEFLRLEDER